MLQPNDFRISCSAIGKIMTEPRSKKSGELSETCKTYLEEWVKQKLYDRRKDFSTKHTAKGNKVEDDAIQLCSNVYDWAIATEKNVERKSCDFMEGTCDVVRYEDNAVADTKCSFDCFSFPLFEAEVPDIGYWWQLQGYGHLYGVKKLELIYCLMDTPEDMLISEAWKVLKYGNYLETDFDEVLEIVRKKHTYSHLPSNLRLKKFTFDYDPEAIEKIKTRVSQCRLYIESLLNQS